MFSWLRNGLVDAFVFGYVKNSRNIFSFKTHSILAELKVVICCHSLPFAHGASRLGRLDEIHLDAAGREVVGWRMRCLENAITLRGLGNDQLLFGRSDPDDSQPGRGRLKRRGSGIVPDLNSQRREQSSTKQSV